MDSNGHRFWMLAEAEAFDLSDGSCHWSGNCLQVAGAVPKALGETKRADAVRTSNLPPVTVGHFDDWAWYDPNMVTDEHQGAILGASFGNDPAVILGTPEGAKLHDLSVDSEGLLRIAGKLDGFTGMLIADLRGRWADPVAIEIEDAEPDRVAEKWLLERRTGRIWREHGIGLADLAVRTYADHIFRPDPEYTNPLRLEELDALEIKSGERILDCAADSGGLLAVLSVSSSAKNSSIITFVSPKGQQTRVVVPVDGFAASISFTEERKVALLYPGTNRAIVFEFDSDFSLTLDPSRYPLKSATEMRLCRGSTRVAFASAFEGGKPVGEPNAVHALSLRSYRAIGTADAAEPVIAERADMLWHRLVVEGDFPSGTGAKIKLRCANSEAGLESAQEHVMALGATDASRETPRLTWLDTPSELPLKQTILNLPISKDRTGTFSGLVQNTTSISREVAGRYAKLQIELFSNGQSTPSIGAIRLYGDRFSLVKNYLPEVLRPDSDPSLRDQNGFAAPLDFYDRFTANFEHILTRLEDAVVAAPSLTNPLAAPEMALEWLSGWIGLTQKSGFTERQRRVMLANGMRLHRRRGTIAGLKLALDIASEGQVGQGGIVVLEDFRLRRVFATILGANLGQEFDPLLAGPVESGNSFVGPTLHLGDAAEMDGTEPVLSKAQEVEIAALYAAPTDTSEADAIRAFFERLSYRVTVLVHHDADETRMALIRDVAKSMAPSHIKLRVERASKPLILGLYSLLGVDSYLKPRPGAEPVIVDTSLLGEKDRILSLPSLDPNAAYGGTS